MKPNNEKRLGHAMLEVIFVGKKNRKRPLDTVDFDGMELVSSSEMTGAMPAQLTAEEQSEAFDRMFNLTRQKPYND